MPTPEPGGAVPPIGALFTETIDDLSKNFGGYALATLGFLAVAVPVTMFLVFGVIIAVNILVAIGIAGSAAAADASGGDAGGLVALGGTFGTIGLAVLGFFGIILLAVTVASPFSASLQRAVAAHQRGEEPLSFNAAFRTWNQNVVAYAMVLLFVTGASFVGVMFCYVGALVPAVLFGFAPFMVALHGAGAGAALGATSRHARANLKDHLVYAGLVFVVNVVASQIPVLGQGFVTALTVRGYRKVFGDGAAPAV